MRRTPQATGTVACSVVNVPPVRPAEVVAPGPERSNNLTRSSTPTFTTKVGGTGISTPPSANPSANDARTSSAPAIADDRACYVLNPGNYGGLPTNDDSLDQLPLYDGLTPLRDNVTDADLDT